MTVEGDRLVDAVVRFAALLRRAGLAPGTGQVLDTVRALGLVEMTVRDDVYTALRAVLLNNHAQEAAFAEAFKTFWRGLETTIQHHEDPLAG